MKKEKVIDGCFWGPAPIHVILDNGKKKWIDPKDIKSWSFVMPATGENISATIDAFPHFVLRTAKKDYTITLSLQFKDLKKQLLDADIPEI